MGVEFRDFYTGRWGLEAETGRKVKVAVTVIETVQPAIVPVPLMVEVEGIKEIAGGPYKGHLGGDIGGEQAFFALNGVRETVAVTETWRKGDVVEPAVMENPTVTVAYEETEVTVTETIIGIAVGQVTLEFRPQGAHVHDDILMAQVNARQQGAGTALLVLGIAIGGRLGVVGVVEDVVGVQPVTFPFQSGKDFIPMPRTQPVQMHGTIFILAVIGLDKDA